MKNARIIIIDDDPIIPQLIKHCLMLKSEADHYRFDISWVQDGRAGLEQIRKTCPDLILLDVHMPELDGYGVLDALRSAGNTTPVILMTASRKEDIREKQQAQYDVYLMKPFPLILLYQYIQKQLQKNVLH